MGQKRRKKDRLGYRLHIDRLHFASDTAVTRTFKFPLAVECYKKGKKRYVEYTGGEGLLIKQLAEAVKHDDLYIRGPSNLVDYVKYYAGGKSKPIYTLIDFWFDSLRAGVVFMPDKAKLVDFVTRVRDGRSIFYKVIEDADPRIARFFDARKFIEDIVAKGEFRQNKSRGSLVSTLQKLLKKDLSEEEKKDAEQFIEEIASAFFDESGVLKIPSKEAQNQVWLKSFNLDKGAVDLDFKVASSAYIFPELVSDPDVEVTPENILVLFDRIVSKRKEWLLSLGFSEEEITTLIDRSLGLSDNFNAFSNYFGETLKTLKKYGFDEIRDSILKVYRESPADLEVQMKMWRWLANNLQDLEGPKLFGVTGWHEYRSLLGGKLQSWWSNHKNRADEQVEQLQKLRFALEKITDFVGKYPNDDREYDKRTLESRRKDIYALLREINDLIEDQTVIQRDLSKYEILESTVKSLRQKLNEYFQLYYKSDTRTAESPSDVSDLKDFWTLRIYKPRSFYGYAQRERLQKLVFNTISTIKGGISLVRELLQSLHSQPDYQKAVEETEKNKVREDAGLRRLLEVLWRKLKDSKVNTEQFRGFYAELLTSFVEDEKIRQVIKLVAENQGKDSKNTEAGKYTFYKSEYSTSTLSQIELRAKDATEYKTAVSDIMNKLFEGLMNFDEQEIISDPKLLLDWIETSKLIIARYFRWMPEREWNLDDFNFERFPAAAKYVKYLRENNKHTVDNPTLRRIIMSYVFSELRGAATVYSKKRVKVKWSVQIVGSDSKFKLVIMPKKDDLLPKEILKVIANGSKEERVELLRNIKWGVRINTKQGTKSEVVVLKDKDGSFKISKEPMESILHICTSRYHLQFLERLIYRPSRWQNVTIRVSEPSLTVEETYSMAWDLERELPVFSKVPTKNTPLLYYTIPFQFNVDRAGRALTELQEIKSALEGIKVMRDDGARVEAWRKFNKDRLYYLGADIGEYGIAWVVAKIVEGNDSVDITVEDYGFEYDKQIRKIQDRFAEIQQQARLGVFLEDTTILANLRENAIGYLRNRLHDRLLKYKGHIVYEANISGFEVGVGRITKIYDSVKRVDVGNHPDMGRDVGQKLVHHIWGMRNGGKSRSPGWQVGAAGTSYTCVACGRTIYGLGADSDQWDVVAKDCYPNIHIIKPQDKDIGDLEVFGYKEHKSERVPDTIDYRTARGWARNFARPPLVKHNKESGEAEAPAVIQYFVLPRKIKGLRTLKELERLKRKRGNSSLFVCPFKGCNAVVDADVQAALVIAVRGYLYMKEYYVHKKDKPFDGEGEKARLLRLTSKLLRNARLHGNTGFVYWHP